MKSLLFVITGLLAIALASCSKDIVIVAGQPAMGEWQWVSSIGGIAVQTIAPAAKSVITLSLNSDSTYIAYLNNETKTEGRYYFTVAQNGDSILQFDKAFQIENLYLQAQQLVMHKDSSTLELFDYNISDGFESQFSKVN